MRDKRTPKDVCGEATNDLDILCAASGETQARHIQRVWFWDVHFSQGFYLGYLRRRSFPRNAQLPPKIKLSLQYISNYIEKIIQTRRGQCTRSKYALSKDTI